MNSYKHIQTIIKIAIEKSELRDEIYSQLMKQTTNNPSANSRVRGWHIIACCIVLSFCFVSTNDGKQAPYVLDQVKNYYHICWLT